MSFNNQGPLKNERYRPEPVYSLESRQEARARIKNDIEKFLASGGEVKRYPTRQFVDIKREKLMQQDIDNARAQSGKCETITLMSWLKKSSIDEIGVLARSIPISAGGLLEVASGRRKPSDKLKETLNRMNVTTPNRQG